MTTARSVARWTETSKGSPGPSNPSESRNTMRCALDETGKNSVRPWMKPRIAARRASLIGGRAPLLPRSQEGAGAALRRGYLGPSRLEQGQVVVHHHSDELLEGDPGLPPEP